MHIIHEPIVKKNKKTTNTIISILVVIFGSILMSISTCALINPIKLYAGGVTGIAQIILQVLGIAIKDEWNAYSAYLGILNFILLLPFNVLAFFKLSKKYAIYTSISTIVQTITLMFSNFWMSFEIFKSSDRLVPVIVAAALGGIANGLMMRRGGTSGGIITLCQYLNIKKGKSVGFINLIISSFIVLFGAIISLFSSEKTGVLAVGESIETALYTLLFFVLQSIIVDHIHTSYNKVKLEVVTEFGDSIASTLLEEFKHGLTITNNVTGAYTHKNKNILIIVVQTSEVSKYVKRIKGLDEHCFITIIPIIRFSGNFNVQIIDE